MHLHIVTKEMIPIVISASIYGNQWTGEIIHFCVDNIAVVHVVNSLFCRDSHLMHLVRFRVFFASYHNFWVFSSHIEGRHNTTANALSRNNLHTFFSQAPQAP